MINDFLDPDNLGKPSKETRQLVAAILVICVVIVIMGFVYYAVQLADLTIGVMNETAKEVLKRSRKTSKELEDIQKQLERLEEEEKLYQMKQRELNREYRELKERLK